MILPDECSKHPYRRANPYCHAAMASPDLALCDKTSISDTVLPAFIFFPHAPFYTIFMPFPPSDIIRTDASGEFGVEVEAAGPDEADIDEVADGGAAGLRRVERGQRVRAY